MFITHLVLPANPDGCREQVAARWRFSALYLPRFMRGIHDSSRGQAAGSRHGEHSYLPRLSPSTCRALRAASKWMRKTMLIKLSKNQRLEVSHHRPSHPQ
jgi:hypothetical protein